MEFSRDRIQVLYEISLSIGPEETLVETAQNALTAYLQKLNCSAGAVVETRPDTPTVDVVASVPTTPSINETLQAGIDALEGPDGLVTADLPVQSHGEDTSQYSILDLPEFGVLVLVTGGHHLDGEMISALQPLNEKLADACRGRRTKEQLRAERDRFETLFETIPEPVASISVEDGKPLVKNANPMFEETFGADGSEQEPPLESLLDTESGPEDSESAGHTEILKRELECETVDGRRWFTLRSAPVDDVETRLELFALFVDVTDKRRRQRTLEQLYQRVRSFLEETDPQAVCQRAAEVACEVLGFAGSQISLYDRRQQGLVPVATAGDGFDRFGDTTGHYDSRDGVLWDVYRSDDPVTIDDAERSGRRFVFPIDGHGVFVMLSEQPSPGNSERYFGQLLSTMLRTALDRVERERTLHAIQKTTTELVRETNSDTLGETLIERTAETFSMPILGLWEYDELEGVFRPACSTAETATLCEEIAQLGPDETTAWEAFTAGEPRLVDSSGDPGGAYDAVPEVRSELIVPVGSYGIVAAGSRLDADFTQSELELLQTLATSAELAISLGEQRRDLEILDQVLARVLRHNIRNDLNVITGSAKQMRKQCGTCSDLIDRIVRTGDRLQLTAENAHKMRRIVDRRGQQTTVDLADVIDGVVAEIATQHPSAEISVNRADDIQCTAHPDIDEAIAQLLENSIEHSPASDPSVCVRATARDDDVLLQISDNGPGIPQEELKPLEQNEETMLTHGSGVGLWIVDRLVDYSNGSLSFETDDGTTAMIRL